MARTTGILVPLYTYPTDRSWYDCIYAKKANPSVPVVCVINPANGCGPSQNVDYANGIKNLQQSGIKVLGYVYTSYGTRPSDQVNAEVLNYKDWYAVDGVFYDEMSTAGSLAYYYLVLAGYAKGLDLPLTVGNPGTGVDPQLLGVFGVLCLWEKPGIPGNVPGGSAFVAEGVASLPSPPLSWAGVASYVYITDEPDPPTYERLPSYFAQEVALLASAAPPPPPPAQVSISIDCNGPVTVTVNGKQVAP